MTNAQQLEKLIDSWELRYFKGCEFTWLWSRVHPSGVRNSVPPKELWGNIARTLAVADAVRHELGTPMTITSAYRNVAYNAAVGGARGSQHILFNALDLGTRTPKTAEEIAIRMRGKRLVDPSTGERFTFRGGVKGYVRQNFVHIDTRGIDANW